MEEFKEIPGYEPYKANKTGQIRGRYGAILKKRLDRHGYVRIQLRLNGIKKNAYAHRLVALSFIPNPDNKPQVNHKNGIRTDNRVENLEWVTNKENVIHGFKNGRKGKTVKGDDSRNSILKSTDIPTIKDMIKKGETFKSIGEKYGVSLSTIYSIKSGKNWNHVK